VAEPSDDIIFSPSQVFSPARFERPKGSRNQLTNSLNKSSVHSMAVSENINMDSGTNPILAPSAVKQGDQDASTSSPEVNSLSVLADSCIASAEKDRQSRIYSYMDHIDGAATTGLGKYYYWPYQCVLSASILLYFIYVLYHFKLSTTPMIKI